MRIFLIGYMGCGKSSIGKPLARKLGLRFWDMDAEIEREEGMTISEIFASKGEDYFREAERRVISGFGNTDDILVSTGGGAPCFFDNMERMNRLGCTIYLSMSPEKLCGRLRHGKGKRPLLRDKSEEELRDFIRENLARRERYYSKATLTINCDGVTDEYIARHIEMFLEYYRKGCGVTGAQWSQETPGKEAIPRAADETGDAAGPCGEETPAGPGEKGKASRQESTTGKTSSATLPKAQDCGKDGTEMSCETKK